MLFNKLTRSLKLLRSQTINFRLHLKRLHVGDKSDGAVTATAERCHQVFALRVNGATADCHSYVFTQQSLVGKKTAQYMFIRRMQVR